TQAAAIACSTASEGAAEGRASAAMRIPISASPNPALASSHQRGQAGRISRYRTSAARCGTPNTSGVTAIRNDGATTASTKAAVACAVSSRAARALRLAASRRPAGELPASTRNPSPRSSSSGQRACSARASAASIGGMLGQRARRRKNTVNPRAASSPMTPSPPRPASRGATAHPPTTLQQLGGLRAPPAPVEPPVACPPPPVPVVTPASETAQRLQLYRIVVPPPSGDGMYFVQRLVVQTPAWSYPGPAV